MIITSVRHYTDLFDGPEMTEVNGTVDNMPFQYYLTGTYTIEESNSLVPLDEATKLAYDRGAVRSDKVMIAPDFIVQSPKIKVDRKSAYDEANQEAGKKNKSIAKLALTLPRLIAHINELEARIEKLERGK